MSQVAQSGTSFAGPAIDVRWNLGDVLPATSGKIFQSSVLDHLEGMLVEFESSRTLLSESITNGEFMRLLDDYESICRIRAKLGSYAYMYFSQDTKSQDARTFKSRAEEIEADAANRTLFFELWWKSLDSEKTSVLLDNSSSYSVLSATPYCDQAVYSFRDGRTNDQLERRDRKSRLSCSYITRFEILLLTKSSLEQKRESLPKNKSAIYSTVKRRKNVVPRINR